MPILAQLTPDMFGPIVPWIMGASLSMFLLNQAITFYKDHIREQPSPANTYATKEELRQAHGRMNRERIDIDKAIAAVAAQSTELGRKLDEEITAIGEQVRQNNADGETRVTVLHNRLNGLPVEIINLLRSTKGLIK